MSRIYGHRGASGYAPENTLEAFRLAAEMGADGVELDVHLSRDGEVVVTHDEKIDRVSDGTGYVKDYTLTELKRFRFNRTHPEYMQAAIPTLREVFELLGPTGLHVNVELKTGYIDRVLYSSFNHRSLTKIKEIDPSLPCGLLYELVMIEPWEYAASRGMNALHPHLSELRYPDLVPEAHRRGLEVNPWTVNSEEDILACAKAGADRIITNYPDLAVGLLRNA